MRIGRIAAVAALGLVLLGGSPAQADVLYSVRAGDTLERIAQKYGLTKAQVLQANPALKDGKTPLEEGLVMVLPVTESETAEGADDQVLAGLRQDPPAPTSVELKVTADEAASRAGDRHKNAQLASRRGRIAQNLLATARRFMGVPYAMGGTTSRAFDCSGFTMRVYQMHGIQLPRTADVQYNVGKKVPKGSEEPGDLVFFETYLPGPSHVGIYVGNGRFIHASSSRGVTVSALGETYYKRRYLGAKRVF